MMKLFVCNYCFVMECLDRYPENIKNTKCLGLSEKDSLAGRACSHASKLIMESDAHLD